MLIRKYVSVSESLKNIFSLIWTFCHLSLFKVWIVKGDHTDTSFKNPLLPHTYFFWPSNDSQCLCCGLHLDCIVNHLYAFQIVISVEVTFQTVLTLWSPGLPQYLLRNQYEVGNWNVVSMKNWNDGKFGGNTNIFSINNKLWKRVRDELWI